MAKQEIMPRPQKEYFNNSKVANYISTNTGIVDVASLQLTTIPKKNIFVAVDLTSDENFKLSNPNVTQYDLAVMDAAYTILKNGRDSFTPEMIVRIMAGNMDLDVTPQKKAAVTRSLNKLRHIDITIDCTEEFRARKLIGKDDKDLILSSYLMPLEKISFTPAFHKEKIEGFRFIKEPVLYTYAESVKQIIDAPTELLEMTNVNMTDDFIILRDYLLKRIATMKNPKNHRESKRITYEWTDKKDGKIKGLLPDLGYTKEYQEIHSSNWRRKKSEIHKSVLVILDNFKEKEFIEGYEVIISDAGRKTIYGVDIVF